MYLFWNYSTAESAGLDLSGYPAVKAHAERVLAHPSVQRMLAEEAAGMKSLGW